MIIWPVFTNHICHLILVTDVTLVRKMWGMTTLTGLMQTGLWNRSLQTWKLRSFTPLPRLLAHCFMHRWTAHMHQRCHSSTLPIVALEIRHLFFFFFFYKQLHTYVCLHWMSTLSPTKMKFLLMSQTQTLKLNKHGKQKNTVKCLHLGSSVSIWRSTERDLQHSVM